MSDTRVGHYAVHPDVGEITHKPNYDIGTARDAYKDACVEIKRLGARLALLEAVLVAAKGQVANLDPTEVTYDLRDAIRAADAAKEEGCPSIE